MAKKKYLDIIEKLRELSPYDIFDRSLVAIIADLEGFKNDYPEYRDLRISVFHSSWQGDNVEFYLFGTRTETENERLVRLAADKKHRDKIKARKKEQNAEEIALLKKLLNKHGGDLQFDIHKLMEE